MDDYDVLEAIFLNKLNEKNKIYFFFKKILFILVGNFSRLAESALINV